MVDQAKKSPANDEDGGVVGLAVGSGILFIQICAVIPGLLPCLLLLLPVVILGAVGAILIAVPLGLLRLARAIRHAGSGRRPPKKVADEATERAAPAVIPAGERSHAAHPTG